MSSVLISAELVPVYNEKTSPFFVNNIIVPPKIKYFKGLKVLTSPLRTGIDIDLLSICSSYELLAKDVISHTNKIIGDVRLKNIYLKLDIDDDFDVLEIDVGIASESLFKPIENSKSILSTKIETVVVRLIPNIKNQDSSFLTAMSDKEYLSYLYSFNLNITATIDIATGIVKVCSDGITDTKVFDDIDYPYNEIESVSKIINMINQGEVIGFDISGYRGSYQYR